MNVPQATSGWPIGLDRDYRSAIGTESEEICRRFECPENLQVNQKSSEILVARELADRSENEQIRCAPFKVAPLSKYKQINRRLIIIAPKFSD